MNTKVVYVLTSTLSDTYLEQMWISIYSLRLVQPDAFIQVVTDRQTSETLKGTRSAWQSLVDNVLVIDCPAEYNSLLRSRYLKTNLRSLLSGDYLFVDTDTVFGAPIQEIDQIEGDICGVLDHVQSRLKRTSPSFRRAEKLGWGERIGDQPYINTGILLVKDSAVAHRFYEIWNRYWQEAAKQNIHYDQLAFSMAKMDTGDLVKEIPAQWNYQIKGMFLGTEYQQANIFHYFSSVSVTQWPMTIVESPLVYSYMREHGEIPSDLQERLHDPLALFQQRITCLNLQQQQFLTSPVYRFLNRHQSVCHLLNRVASGLSDIRAAIRR